ncbi:hydroxyacid dehydrogenase [Aurantimonas sp. HBX-1]|uniref:hydroxyacid dehydrogenase n=1 Tax=Aurantimonas sp. HBX-1 TaxID=2906072 RepID=UPI001F2E105F|nr:hydroxyacid dehydrogenase [Aurantimonas sp. HBX-1]UIJ73445.1 hydroxyacid dehydrogenase [Aurantimonas sp. HBX-1]
MATALLTDPIDPTMAARLEQHARILTLEGDDPGELEGAIAEADVVLVRRAIPAEFLSKASRLRALLRHGAGLDFIPLSEASRLAIAVTNVPNANANAVAEHAIGVMLALARRISVNDRSLRRGAWSSLRTVAPETTELGGRTVGLIGYGNIGQRLAAICRLGFGMRVLATRRSEAARSGSVTFVDLLTLLEESDFVVIACPLTKETQGMIGPCELDRMRRSAFLVNVARGAIVDEDALASRLADGRLAGAALDVFTTQPLPVNHLLRRLETVVLTPHVAGITGESMRAMSETAVEDAIAIIGGRRPIHLVNADEWPRILSRWQQLGAKTDSCAPSEPG